jgi:putative Mg2+ transporter-C (MgtC) family protein
MGVPKSGRERQEHELDRLRNSDVTALLLGGVIGLERQWRQRMTGLRTNGLVAVGSAMFVMMGGLIVGDGSQGRVAAYVVSGIGFLGGGVILKDGFNIRGLNTAATLWCTAAVGTLAGLGRFDFAVLGALGVLSANLILRPIAHLVNPHLNKRENMRFSTECVVPAGLTMKQTFGPS